MKPVVVGHPSDSGPLRLPASLSVQRQIDQKLLRRELIKEWLGGLRDQAPGCERLRERWRAHRATSGEVSLDIVAQHDSLRTVEEIALLLPGEVADDPTDRIHSAEVPRAGVLADALQAAQPFATGESELIDERMQLRRGLGR